MKINKAAILAGGTGSRLLPLTKTTNKHLLMVGGKPMLIRAIEQLTTAGIREFVVVTGPEYIPAMEQTTGTGQKLGCKIQYAPQAKPAGIADALAQAKDFVGGEPCAVLLGDNLFSEPLAPFLKKFSEQTSGARVLLKTVSDPERFGVAEIEGDTIISIEEKPKRPKSNCAVVGLYFYDSQVWEAIPSLEVSARGELEVTDINNFYARLGQLKFDKIQTPWFDAGTIESLGEADSFFLKVGS